MSIQEKQYLPLSTGDIRLSGYPKRLIDYVIKDHFENESLWKLLANQFRLHSDSDGDWRGEFWGKSMRGACLAYQVAPSAKLYNVLKNSVLDLLSTQDKDGRLSAYPREKDFYGWDMWGRKYALVGLLAFYSICKSESLKRRILRASMKSADDILKHVGTGRNKIEILKTSQYYNAYNSASILKVYTELYRLTGKDKYLKFASYILSRLEGLFADIEAGKYPYEFAVKKAYEEISCIEGVIDYYELTGEERYLRLASEFTEKMLESDFTIIGCAGCDGEFFDHSSITQTAPSAEIMQETCVTVTIMGLVSRLFSLTGDNRLMDALELSTYNAFFGSVNNERQTMASAKGNVWTLEGCSQAPHGTYPFDSYSPLAYGKRATQVGGFKVLQDGEGYGCCACNGAKGFGIFALNSVTKKNNGLVVSLYFDSRVNTEVEGQKIQLDIKANFFTSHKAKIKVSNNEKEFPLTLRVPSWAKKAKVSKNGEEIIPEVSDGYLTLLIEEGGANVVIEFVANTKAVILDGSVAYVNGPIVLARDARFADGMEEPLPLAKAKSIRFKKQKNNVFSSNVCYSAKLDGKTIYLCDYAQAGKNSDDPKSLITVWHKTK